MTAMIERQRDMRSLRYLLAWVGALTVSFTLAGLIRSHVVFRAKDGS